jgi:hypothetical protein
MAADLIYAIPRGLESIQGAMDDAGSAAGGAVRLADRPRPAHPRAAHHPLVFLRALRMLVAGQYLVFEIPDCTKFIGTCDYSFLWKSTSRNL